MGCSHDTAKQTIRIHEISTTTTTIASSHLDARTRNCINKTGKQLQNNNSKLNQHLSKNHTNDDCQLVRVQQKLPTTHTRNTTTANKTSTPSVSKIYNFNNKSNKSNNGIGTSKSNKKEIIFCLEKKENRNRSNYAVSVETINLEKAKDNNDNVTALQESCINCYPLACRNRFRCEQQHKQTHLVVGEIVNQTRQNLKQTNYINANHSKSYHNNNSSNRNCTGRNNCNNNNYCRCHLSLFYPKHTKNTLRNEQQCEPHCRCNCVATQTNDFATFKTAHWSNGNCLQKTISQARTSLTTNALDLKNNLIEVMTNCATVAESMLGIKSLLIKNCLNGGIGSSRNSNNGINNIDTNNNHNKSEPYRGYCQRKHNLLNKFNYTSSSSSTASSSSITSTSNSTTSSLNSSRFPLHDAISSNSRCNNHNHDMDNTSNITSCSTSSNNNNSKRLNKSCSNNYNCQASSAHTAAFNYVGQNYYSFLRNTINFYTASSVILVLCYLTSTTSAATTKSDSTAVDKHPM